MIIHLKNKYQLAFDRMVKECNDKGGVPDFIEVDPQEAWGILREMQTCRDKKEVKDKFKIEQKDPGEKDARFAIYGKEPITIDVANPLVGQWIRREIVISFDGIPIRVNRPPPKKEESDTEKVETKPEQQKSALDDVKDVDKDPET